MVEGEFIKQRFFTMSEVHLHNTPDDIWVSFLGKVYNLTPLHHLYKGEILLRSIVQSAGEDISHWFDGETQDIRTHIDPLTGCRVPYTPVGRFLHIPPQGPRTDWLSNFGKPWWKDDIYCIGQLSSKTRKILLLDTLISQEKEIEVCSEETMNEIGNRYLKFNKHGFSYTWKYKGKCLDMNKTLEGNGILDECNHHYGLRLDETQYLPQIHLFFNDDLTYL